MSINLPSIQSTVKHRLSILQVEPIVQSVRQRGDAAVREFTEKFDRATVDTVCTPIEAGIVCDLTNALQQ